MNLDNFHALVVHSGGDINTTGYFEPAADQLIEPGPGQTDTHTRTSDPRRRRSP
jgi:hypothetical protein